ncbi:NAD(P)-dependent dehydrogenase (short-subunit alcohol dehydrogenase family) [Labrenzia sp. EL_195]|nr:NAD(P)-dependent dehydrogenase (short-subunit alcohol dehydrogenase family) [Labrenzia sp. EL_195]
MRLAKAVLSHIGKHERGSFVAISGIEAGQPRLPFTLGPTRLALHRFIKLLADRYGRQGIRLNAVAPGLKESAQAEFTRNGLKPFLWDRWAAMRKLAEPLRSFFQRHRVT